MEVLDKLAEAPPTDKVIESLKPEIGTWHTTYTVGYLTATGMITGCGLMQVNGLYNYAGHAAKNIKKDFEALKVLVGQKQGNQYKCRTLIATMGNYAGDSAMLDMIASLGFKEIAHYINAAHEYSGEIGSTTDWQKLFIHTW